MVHLQELPQYTPFNPLFIERRLQLKEFLPNLNRSFNPLFIEDDLNMVLEKAVILAFQSSFHRERQNEDTSYELQELLSILFSSSSQWLHSSCMTVSTLSILFSSSRELLTSSVKLLKLSSFNPLFIEFPVIFFR